MKAVLKSLTALVAVSLCIVACTTPPRSSYGQAATRVERATLVVENANDAMIDITRYSRASEKLRVTEGDQTDARQKILRLNRIFDQGMRESLPRLAADRGLTLVASNDGTRHKMVVRALTRRYECRLSCVAVFVVRADVYDAAGNTIWWFWRPFGQRSAADPIGAATFVRFANEMLDLMQKEDVLVKR